MSQKPIAAINKLLGVRGKGYPHVFTSNIRQKSLSTFHCELSAISYTWAEHEFRTFARDHSKGESLNVEFKGGEKASLPDSALVEAVICLANRSGEEPGWLLVGVEDDR